MKGYDRHCGSRDVGVTVVVAKLKLSFLSNIALHSAGSRIFTLAHFMSYGFMSLVFK